jgi:NhaP-type Na+/H+ or K+/H+ antiporter
MGSTQMNSLADPAVAFVVVLLIGILAGCLVQWVTGSSWLSRQITGTGRVYVTSALVWVAGSFIGFHFASLFRLSGPDRSCHLSARRWEPL